MEPAETTGLNFTNHLLLERLAVTHYYLLFYWSDFRSKTDNLFQDATPVLNLAEEGEAGSELKIPLKICCTE